MTACGESLIQKYNYGSFVKLLFLIALDTSSTSIAIKGTAMQSSEKTGPQTLGQYVGCRSSITRNGLSSDATFRHRSFRKH